MRELTLSAFKRNCENYGFSKYKYTSLEMDDASIPHLNLSLIFDKLIVTLQPNSISLCSGKSYISFTGVKNVLMESINTYYLSCRYFGEDKPRYFKICCEK